MIQVRWNLEGNDIDESVAAATLQRLLDYYKRALADVSCPVHGGEPWLDVHGSTIHDLTVSVGSCCRTSRGLADERIRRVSRRDEE